MLSFLILLGAVLATAAVIGLLHRYQVKTRQESADRSAPLTPVDLGALPLEPDDALEPILPSSLGQSSGIIRAPSRKAKRAHTCRNDANTRKRRKSPAS